MVDSTDAPTGLRKVLADWRALRERERGKGTQERAEDMAYTINHAIACMVTDYITMDPLVGAFVEKSLDGNLPEWVPDRFKPSEMLDHLGCKNPLCEDDHHHHDDDHHHPETGSEKLGFKDSTLWKMVTDPTSQRWMIAEFITDAACVPITVAAQRYVPELMEGIQKLLEPVVGPAMRLRLEAEASRWAKQQGLPKDADEVVARKEEMYRHEMEHLPQAVVWTTLSTLGVGAVHKGMTKIDYGAGVDWVILSTTF